MCTRKGTGGSNPPLSAIIVLLTSGSQASSLLIGQGAQLLDGGRAATQDATQRLVNSVAFATGEVIRADGGFRRAQHRFRETRTMPSET
jgi:hypothetical protein